jgi:hypothetical protein
MITFVQFLNQSQLNEDHLSSDQISTLKSEYGDDKSVMNNLELYQQYDGKDENKAHKYYLKLKHLVADSD